MLDPGYDGTYKKPVQTGSGMASYRVAFEPLQYELRTDAEMTALTAPLNNCELSRFVVREYRFAGNQFTIPGGKLYWRDSLDPTTGKEVAGFTGSAQIPEAYPRIFPEVNVSYTWIDVPGIPWTSINSCLGKVNNTLGGANAPNGAFDYRPDWQGLTWSGGTFNGFDPGTLLFLGTSDIRPKVSATGQQLYDIQYAFNYRPSGHNKIYRASPGDDFYRVVRANYYGRPQAEWKDLLDEADFTSLFKLG
jgi:hypothetical protein